ncbi:MAG: gluconate 2-dehydrogenase subunit 3 family protein [candidate division Zixibacteria bacterium]|nr:gluconate 2-dehydrogenase subunit 3 family protein [candidate division Zixibacteria bacterium]
MDVSRITRRRFLSGAAKVAGGVITLGALTRQGVVSAQTAGEGYAFQHLTAEEGKTLIALCERIFPRDANGPGATDARAYFYIDGGFGDRYREDLETYRKGLAALNAYCQATRTSVFAGLSADEQEKALIELDKRETPTAWPSDVGISGLSFLRMVISHTMEGMFSDPSYGGNHDRIGWKLIKFPGRAPFGYDPPFGYYDMTIPETQYPEFKPYAGPMKSRIVGQPDPKKGKK